MINSILNNVRFSHLKSEKAELQLKIELENAIISYDESFYCRLLFFK